MQTDRLSRQILLHGLTMVLAGLAWGFFVPAVPYPRSGADRSRSVHIQRPAVHHPRRAASQASPRRRSPLGASHVALRLANVAAAVVRSGQRLVGTNKMLPLAAAQAAANGGQPWQEIIVQLTHAVAGFALLVAWRCC